MTDDNINLKKLIYASCWSYHENEDHESYPLWINYTNRKGIRLQISFEDYPFTKNKLKHNKKPLYYNIAGPNKIIYRNKNKVNALSTKEYESNGLVSEEIKLLDKEIGLVKNEFWKGENEYRYRIINIPNRLIHIAVKVEAEPSVSEIVKYGDLTNLTNRREIFIELKKQFFEKMKVKLGPDCEYGDIVIVKALMEKYLGRSELSWSKYAKNKKKPIVINPDVD